ncbi:MAG: hypothetical protein HFG70_05040 [Hungatella sp.]|nr:hypothetical protein [Hungatella sp.]
MNRRTYRSSRPYKYKNYFDSDLVRLLLFYILPFIVVNGIIFFLATTRPKYELVVEGTNDYRTTEVTFTIKSIMPLKEVTIKMDSQPVDLVKVGKKKYRATIDHNGSLEIYMLNFNKMALLEYEHIDILDDEPPTIENASSEDGILSFTIRDTQSGVDFSSISATNPMGEFILPLSADKATGRVSFQMNGQNLTVSAKDMSGNEFLTTFSLTAESASQTPPEETEGEGETTA